LNRRATAPEVIYIQAGGYDFTLKSLAVSS